MTGTGSCCCPIPLCNESYCWDFLRDPQNWQPPGKIIFRATISGFVVRNPGYYDWTNFHGQWDIPFSREVLSGSPPVCGIISAPQVGSYFLFSRLEPMRNLPACTFTTPIVNREYRLVISAYPSSDESSRDWEIAALIVGPPFPGFVSTGAFESCANLTSRIDGGHGAAGWDGCDDVGPIVPGFATIDIFMPPP